MHTIRLRRPWLRSLDPHSPPQKVDVPDTQPPTTTDGSVISYRRAFNRPTGLTPADVVWLSLPHHTAESIEIRINDALVHQSVHPSKATGPIRIDITASLQSANQLVITLTTGRTSPAALDAPVTLEIESEGS
ncbi:hypothetical protein [Stieleria mannarensis]|uniref:hypothetical protein n=1 Tax=Stieleria mannarensis TaxID=2755585 RepID=UPI001601D03D|nr:hypothetical protein [Rhodopirellula sp. JC639]